MKAIQFHDLLPCSAGRRKDLKHSVGWWHPWSGVFVHCMWSGCWCDQQDNPADACTWKEPPSTPPQPGSSQKEEIWKEKNTHYQNIIHKPCFAFMLWHGQNWYVDWNRIIQKNTQHYALFSQIQLNINRTLISPSNLCSSINSFWSSWTEINTSKKWRLLLAFQQPVLKKTHTHTGYIYIYLYIK